MNKEHSEDYEILKKSIQLFTKSIVNCNFIADVINNENIPVEMLEVLCDSKSSYIKSNVAKKS